MGFNRRCTVALMAVTEKQPLGHTCHTAQRELARANVLRNGRLKNNSTLNHGNGNDIARTNPLSTLLSSTFRPDCP